MNKKQDVPKTLPWDNPRFKNWVAMMRAEKAVGRALSRALAPLDLKVAQLDAMINLYRHPGQSQHDLARRLLVGRSNITMLLPQLETQGLLRREGDPRDKRVMRLYLTEEGEKKLMQAEATQGLSDPASVKGKQVHVVGVIGVLSPTGAPPPKAKPINIQPLSVKEA